MAEKWNGSVQRICTVVHLQGCSNPGRNAKNDSDLSYKRDRYGGTWMFSFQSCKHITTQIYKYKFNPFCESAEDLCEKIREDITGGPSILITRKAVVDETSIRVSSIINV